MNLGAQWVYSLYQLTYMELVHSPPFTTSDSPVAFNATVRLHTGIACPASGRGQEGREDQGGGCRVPWRL